MRPCLQSPRASHLGSFSRPGVSAAGAALPQYHGYGQRLSGSWRIPTSSGDEQTSTGQQKHACGAENFRTTCM